MVVSDHRAYACLRCDIGTSGGSQTRVAAHSSRGRIWCEGQPTRRPSAGPGTVVRDETGDPAMRSVGNAPYWITARVRLS